MLRQQCETKPFAMKPCQLKLSKLNSWQLVYEALSLRTLHAPQSQGLLIDRFTIVQLDQTSQVLCGDILLDFSHHCIRK